MIVGALALYLWGVQRVNRLRPRHPWSTLKTAAFIGGLVTTAISIFTFIGVYDEELVLGPHGPAPPPDHGGRAPLRHLLADRSVRGGPRRARVARAIHRSCCARATATVLGHPGVAFVALCRADPDHPLDGLVQLHARAPGDRQRRAPDLPRGGLHVLAPDLRQRPQPLPDAPRTAVRLPLPGHPHRHVHGALAGPGGARDVPGLPRLPSHLGPVAWSTTSTSGASSCGWPATRSCCGR